MLDPVCADRARRHGILLLAKARLSAVPDAPAWQRQDRERPCHAGWHGRGARPRHGLAHDAGVHRAPGRRGETGLRTQRRQALAGRTRPALGGSAAHLPRRRPVRVREHANPWGQGPRAANPVSSWPVGVRGAGPVPNLVWRVKLVTELEPGVATETEVARIERDEEAGLADLGLRLEEVKRLTAALQAEIVPAQVTTVGERRRWCTACGQMLASKGHYPATFRSLFGDVPVRVRRLLVCPCHGPGEPKSFAALDLGWDAVAPELA